MTRTPSNLARNLSDLSIYGCFVLVIAHGKKEQTMVNRGTIKHKGTKIS